MTLTKYTPLNGVYTSDVPQGSGEFVRFCGKWRSYSWQTWVTGLPQWSVPY
ncbi:MAG: hypothetical protein IPG80_14060 [Anaerolineales bacterium]|uniref:hypothetical protein n=1 Tax=Candidatus Villigracilis vicinus TaxID=3140679 RepID=UPI0031350ACD|nr:hypothetical protein [Anaerolineales bacterium]